LVPNAHRQIQGHIPNRLTRRLNIWKKAFDFHIHTHDSARWGCNADLRHSLALRRLSKDDPTHPATPPCFAEDLPWTAFLSALGGSIFAQQRITDFFLLTFDKVRQGHFGRLFVIVSGLTYQNSRRKFERSKRQLVIQTRGLMVLNRNALTLEIRETLP
jgi:hypothetical protein